MSTIGVIDYSVGNLLSISRACEHVGLSVTMIERPEDFSSVDRLILPGVGAFAHGIDELNKHGFVDAIHEFVITGKPLLGICLGMQMLFSRSHEFGLTAGLDLIPGEVVPIPRTSPKGIVHKIPHIGWNELQLPADRTSWQSTALHNCEPGQSVYFVHSFMAVPADSSHNLAICDYNGLNISAAVQHENIVGCQFHPEKSGEVGLAILERFRSI